MAYKRLRAPSLTDLFVEEIKRMILSGELSTGEKLPPERQLAEEMDVSPAVIHAGISRLAAIGFLDVIPRQGTFVADYIRYGNINTMMEILDFAGRQIDHTVLDPLSVLRRSIELGSSRLACLNRTDANLAVMDDLLRKITESKDPGSIPELAFRVQHEIAVASGNIYYPMIIMTFHPVYVSFYKYSLASEEARSAIASQLIALCSAIRDKDCDAAELAVHRNVDAWMKRIEESGKIDKTHH